MKVITTLRWITATLREVSRCSSTSVHGLCAKCRAAIREVFTMLREVSGCSSTSVGGLCAKCRPAIREVFATLREVSRCSSMSVHGVFAKCRPAIREVFATLREVSRCSSMSVHGLCAECRSAIREASRTTRGVSLDGPGSIRNPIAKRPRILAKCPAVVRQSGSLNRHQTYTLPNRSTFSPRVDAGRGRHEAKRSSGEGLSCTSVQPQLSIDDSQ